jgi:hypothetical protein
MSRIMCTAAMLASLACAVQLSVACDGEETRAGNLSTVGTSTGGSGQTAGGGDTGTAGGGQGANGGGGAGGGFDAASGVVVVAGTNQGVDVVYVLDRDTGKSLYNETLKTAAVTHDGVSDSFYLFVTSDLPVPPGTKGSLYAKRFDVHTNTWQLLEELEPVDLPREPQDVVIFGQSLLYLAERNTPPGTDLVAFRIANPTHVEGFFPEAIDVSTSHPNDTIIGLTGSAAGAINGGTAHVIVQRDLGGGNCQMFIQRYTVADASIVAAGTALQVGPVYDCMARPAWTADDKTASMLFAVPPASGENTGVILRLQPKTLSVDQQVPLSFAGAPEPRTLRSMTLDACNQIAFITVSDGSASHGLWATPLDDMGEIAVLATPDPVSQVAYDPARRLVLLANQATPGFGVAARRLAGDCLNPSLDPIAPASWTAPLFLSPRATVVPQSLPLKCPRECDL